MDAPFTCQAILLAYFAGHDRNAIELLRPTITIADTPDLEFFQIAAFKLQTAGLLAYISYNHQRIITPKGRSAAQTVLAALISRFGNLEPRILITRLAPDCLRELTVWQAECAHKTQEVLNRHG